ncbi:50S ribosomal protein L9 [Actinobacteria bacterium YIM 96077]|uniref:Large ribosomal subunit protein bL9 n=1 Tax=Phytoactinopolyspora halophila TaxID=1981511 RepID=A0A329QP59_9ACTN|nr:50S ribosomal protein L9 [Phytoactinopolyspora halophila]AYY15083.1 50S ribosomal protein L9 [Actinobacteria bacterium YIM 96077]RAW14154.1 50S ribosomal protein L9 [Phytoactinopolyspora halophila]
MKLILKQEVSGLGSAGDVVEVRDGYGRNYLIPRGYAMAWTKGAQKQIDAIQRARESREIADRDTARAMKERLEAGPIQLKAKAGESGRLFGSITPADIASAVVDAGGPQVDKRRIEVGTPIKSVGEHTVTVRLHEDVSAKIKINVAAA